MNVKPESGRLCFVERRVALSMPSGVGLCTSEQPDPQCAACTADLPALRFCGRLLVFSPRGVWAEGFFFSNLRAPNLRAGSCALWSVGWL